MTIKKFVLVPLILFACSDRTHWTSDQINSKDRESNSTRLTYLSKGTAHGIDLEFLKIGERLSLYLNVHSIPVPPYDGNPKKALVKIITEEGTFSFEAYRFEGGQKFLLPEEASQLLISTLQNRNSATVILAGYRSNIDPENFSKKFHQLNHPLPLKNPFRSPL